MPDIQSATKFIKALNPPNKSGSIPQSLDLLNNLKKIKATMNPKMPEAVGPKELVGALKHIFNLFMNQKKKALEAKKLVKKILTPEEQAELDRLLRMASELDLAIRGLQASADTSAQGDTTGTNAVEPVVDTPADPNNPYQPVEIIRE